MRTLVSLESGRTDEILAWLKQEQIPVEVRTTTALNGLETSEILVKDDNFGRGRAIVEEWYAEHDRIRKKQFWRRVIIGLLFSALLLTLFWPLTVIFGMLLAFDGVFFYVAWKAIRTGVINTRPLAEWTDEIERFNDPIGFWLRVFLCILMGSFFLGSFVYGVTRP